ncbi:MAG: class I SAM-dependent methyltransferase, partial [Lachnospiraceae bacterium]|nr:class I SAM-dependent methyltransferase [Lachnospiraceae bacterium]
MESYTGFASLYDLFMDNIPYKEWSLYLIDLLKEHNITDGIILDLGCGTGNITQLLAKSGYDMIGIDNSDEMLNIALDKKYENELDILYLNQDMRSFELYGTVAAIVSICDSMNYITEYEDLIKVFKLANNYLDPKGLFIFDLNTIYKYRQMGDCTIAESREEGSFIWENTFYNDTNINQY